MSKEDYLMFIIVSGLIMGGCIALGKLVQLATGWNNTLLAVVTIFLWLGLSFYFLIKREQQKMNEYIRADLAKLLSLEAEKRQQREEKRQRAKGRAAEFNKVYFILDTTNNAVKIGVSYDPRTRMAALQTATHHPLILLAVIPGSYELEYSLHQQFSDSRIQGEWFQYSEEIRAYIEQLEG